MSFLFGSQKSVRGDVVVITGGAMGLGRLLALQFAKLGAHVVIWDLHEELGAAVVTEIKRLGVATPRAHFFKVDVTDRTAVYAAAQAVIAKLGGVDILINNAGIVSGRPLLEQSDASDALAAKTMDVNATSHLWTLKAFLPGMVARNKGNIVSVASAAGVFGCGGMVDYSASKYAAVGIMVSLRQELQAMGKHGVHCTLVCPSFIKTGMFEGVQPPLLTSWLTPEYVADSIVRAVRRNQWRLLMPSILHLVEFLAAVLPDFMVVWLIKFTRVAQAMKHFKQTRPHGQALLQDRAEGDSESKPNGTSPTK